MTSWMNDAAVPNHNGAGFNHLNDNNVTGGMLDPSAFMTNPSSFDPSHIQNQQLQQRMQNGTMRNGSPAFNNPVYQTNQVIPSKRPRPREESFSTSPRQSAAMLPNSRSQTPQGSYPYPANSAPQNPAQQPPYSHLQNGTSNASPSPVMGHQIRPGGVPQRVSTASPHSFSPNPQQYPAQASPHSDHGGRSDTPGSSFPQNPGYTPGFQNFTPPPGRTSVPPQHSMPANMPQHLQNPQSQMFAQQNHQRPPGQMPNMDQHRAMYLSQQMRLQQAKQNNAMAAQQRPPGMNPMMQSPSPLQAQNGQFPPAMRQPGPMAGRPTNPDSFMKNLASFMQSQGKPLDMTPQVGDRKINIMMLYVAVSKFGGYRNVTASNGWSQICQAMQIPLENPSAPQILRGHYERYLLAFEEALQSNARQRAMMAGHMPGSQVSPTKQMNASQMQQTQQQYMLQQQAQQQHQIQQQQTPIKQMTQPQHTPTMNGFPTPQTTQLPMGQNHARNSMSRSIEVTPPQPGSAFPMPSPASTKHGSMTLPSPGMPSDPQAQQQPEVEPQVDLPDVFDPRTEKKLKAPTVREFQLPATSQTFGGVDVALVTQGGQELSKFKPNAPTVTEMGMIDIHALTMSLQSGIHGEVRLALDALALLSSDNRVQLDLRLCDDMVETLVECAEDQVEMLAENAAEVSDVMLVSSYEEVMRGCHVENESLYDVPEFGSLDYDLDRAVDRLICVTTILRNFSFLEPNQTRLATEVVIKFLSVVIRYLGTRNMLLRTNRNTLDFMKDVIIFLSNVSHAIELPRREQALCLLHFLLAFAPSPPPNNPESEIVCFAAFDPSIHRYLPPAVDSLAKLLARDEPNRGHYKTIFVSDVTSTPPYDLLTRAFALVISPIPDQKQDTKRGNFTPIVEARKPYLMQGMLAAEILSNLAPGPESGIARSWLMSEDGFSQHLSRLILTLCVDASVQMPQPRWHAPPKVPEDDSLLRIAAGGIAVLRTLAEKSRDPETMKFSIPAYALPAKETLLGALKIIHPKLQVVLRQLCAYAGLDT